MGRRSLAAVATLGLLAAGSPLLGHHAFSAEFDANQPVKLVGTVTRMEWINPHSWIHMDVKGPDGKVTSWMIELGAPNALIRRGFTKNSLPTGTVLTVDGYKAKDGSNRANGRSVITPDGKRLFVGSSGTGAPDTDK